MENTKYQVEKLNKLLNDFFDGENGYLLLGQKDKGTVIASRVNMKILKESLYKYFMDSEISEHSKAVIASVTLAYLMNEKKDVYIGSIEYFLEQKKLNESDILKLKEILNKY